MEKWMLLMNEWISSCTDIFRNFRFYIYIGSIFDLTILCIINRSSLLVTFVLIFQYFPPLWQMHDDSNVPANSLRLLVEQPKPKSRVDCYHLSMSSKLSTSFFIGCLPANCPFFFCIRWSDQLVKTRPFSSSMQVSFMFPKKDFIWRYHVNYEHEYSICLRS